MRKNKKIVVSVITDLATDQRVIRIATTLQEMGFEVIVYARRLKHSLPLDNYSFQARRFRCFFTKGTFQYAEFMIKLFFRLLVCKTDYFLANDLDTLLPNYLVSKWRRKHLFYDTHEYFTGVPELASSPVKRKIWKKIEDWIFPRLKSVYTVNESVRDEYQEEYQVPISVIRNVPVTRVVQPASLPDSWKGKIILLAQGAGLNEGRSCIEMLDALPLMDERFYLVFIGGGTAWDALHRRRQELGLQARVDMMERMVPAKLKSFTALAHLGISLDSFTDKNCLFNLPNKVFDYLHAGVPLFATAIPEVKKIVDQYHCGITITDTSPEYIAHTITALFNDPERYATFRRNALQAARDLNWENEQMRLREIYRDYL